MTLTCAAPNGWAGLFMCGNIDAERCMLTLRLVCFRIKREKEKPGNVFFLGPRLRGVGISEKVTHPNAHRIITTLDRYISRACSELSLISYAKRQRSTRLIRPSRGPLFTLSASALSSELFCVFSHAPQKRLCSHHGEKERESISHYRARTDSLCLMFFP